MRVLITDGHTRAALAMTRSLGCDGTEVHVLAPVARSLAGSSRYCRSEQPQSSTSEAPEALRASLVDAVRRVRPFAVFGVTDPTLTILHDLGRALDTKVVVPPARDQYLLASDKVKLFELASRIGILVPDGLVVPGGQVPSKESLAPLGRPLVVRPAFSWRVLESRWVRGSVSIENDREAIARRAAEDPALNFPYLVQRRVKGEGCGLFLLAERGVVRRVFAHRRLREKPPEGGVSTLCESVAPPDDLTDAGRRFARALDWNGLAMLEFKRSAGDGTALLLEVNARPWGSLALAAASGVEFSRDLLDLACGRSLASDPGYRSGVRLRWWWGDVDHFYLRERASGRAGWVAMLRGFARAASAGPWPEAWDTARIDDPLPFAMETAGWVRA